MRVFLDITISLIPFSSSKRQNKEARLVQLCQVKGHFMGLNTHGTSYGTNMDALPFVPLQTKPRSNVKRKDPGNEVDPALGTPPPPSKKIDVLIK